MLSVWAVWALGSGRNNDVRKGKDFLDNLMSIVPDYEYLYITTRQARAYF